MARVLTVGIDPGLDGAVVALADGVPVFSTVVPTHKVKHGKATRKVYDAAGMNAALDAICKSAWDDGRGEYERPDLVCIEATEPRPPKGRNACHSLGLSRGLWEGLIVAKRWPYQLVRAADWLPKMTKGVPGSGTKDRTIMAAGRLLPTLSLERSARASKLHDGLADAGLLALYAARVTAGGGAEPRL